MSNFSGLGGRKLLAFALTAGAMLASMLTVGASPAAAYGSCSIELPSRLTVDAPYKRFTARLSPDCDESGKDYASWDVEHSYYGPQDIFIFDSGEDTAVWEFYDWGYYGNYTVRPSLAHDYDYNELSQNTVTTQVRLGSRLSLTSSRSGRYVTLRSTATRYSRSASGFRPWASQPVKLYSRTCGTCSWVYFKTLRTDRYGKVSTRFVQRASRYYEARTADTSAAWGRTAATRR